MFAEIVAIGPFCAEVADSLGYPIDVFKTTRNGTTVPTEPFGIVEGSGTSREFAKCLGITDPWDFNQHKIVPSKIDVEGLQKLLKTLRENEDYVRDLARLLVLRERGFEFFFRPNG